MHGITRHSAASRSLRGERSRRRESMRWQAASSWRSSSHGHRADRATKAGAHPIVYSGAQEPRDADLQVYLPARVWGKIPGRRAARLLCGCLAAWSARCPAWGPPTCPPNAPAVARPGRCAPWLLSVCSLHGAARLFHGGRPARPARCTDSWRRALSAAPNSPGSASLIWPRDGDNLCSTVQCEMVEMGTSCCGRSLLPAASGAGLTCTCTPTNPHAPPGRAKIGGVTSCAQLMTRRPRAPAAAIDSNSDLPNSPPRLPTLLSPPPPRLPLASQYWNLFVALMVKTTRRPKLAEMPLCPGDEHGNNKGGEWQHDRRPRGGLTTPLAFGFPHPLPNPPCSPKSQSLASCACRGSSPFLAAFTALRRPPASRSLLAPPRPPRVRPTNSRPSRQAQEARLLRAGSRAVDGRRAAKRERPWF